MNQSISIREKEMQFVKAKHDLHTAINSFDALDCDQRQRLLYEVFAEKQAERLSVEYSKNCIRNQ